MLTYFNVDKVPGNGFQNLKLSSFDVKTQIVDCWIAKGQEQAEDKMVNQNFI